MSDTNPPNKRKHNRIKFDGDISIHPVMQSVSGNILEVAQKAIKAKGGDISEGGIRLELGDTNSPNDIFKVHFKIQTSATVEAYAKLVWKSGHTCGLQFLVLDESSKEQIRNHVEKKKS
jgi:c-di-GMP-binding flagellar brake protein YcgR